MTKVRRLRKQPSHPGKDGPGVWAVKRERTYRWCNYRLRQAHMYDVTESGIFPRGRRCVTKGVMDKILTRVAIRRKNVWYWCS